MVKERVGDRREVRVDDGLLDAIEHERVVDEADAGLDVVAAAAEGRFRIWPVAHFDQAIEHLTGLEAGARGPDGTWPAGSFNRAVADSLDALADRARAFASDPALDAAREQQPGKAP